ncbi:hypothetical protein B5M42_000865 [Paenibacillus athensensis]|uniref:Uncharacterized protein n=1 Tax=Paenibacillus athensensis TaxID=1967502 RepID=A0A4Y8Q856_9BACL|nr:hypothetical protein [Paenibacillus athensensis]MCD1257386.1 hypothetical protein [Paenibacillus athensensis]
MSLWNIQIGLAGALLLIICLLPKGRLALVICRRFSASHAGGFFRTLSYYLPVVNTYMIKRAVYGKASWASWGALILLLGILASMPLAGEGLLSTIQAYVRLNPFELTCMAGFLIAVVLYIVELQLNWDLCAMLDRRRWVVWAILLPPLCSLLLAERMIGYSRKMNFIWDE